MARLDLSSLAILQKSHKAAPVYRSEMSAFGIRLAKARKRKELNGEGLGKLVGVSKQTISHWEKGRYEPNLEQIEALCRVLGTSADWLVLGRASMDLLEFAKAYEQQRKPEPADEPHTLVKRERRESERRVESRMVLTPEQERRAQDRRKSRNQRD